MKLIPEEAAEGTEGAPGQSAGSGATGSGGAKDTDPKGTERRVYTCPMHPEVRQDRPGTCPKCGMKLVPEEKGSGPGKHDGHP